MTLSPTFSLSTFAEHYVAMWNEPDPGTRRRTVETLWEPDGANYTPTIEAVGHDALEQRVTASYAKFVGTGEYRFRAAAPAVAHHDTVKIQWEMITVATGAVASVGLEFLVLGTDGRIVSDHQFVG
jgi:hypothetical protein